MLRLRSNGSGSERNLGVLVNPRALSPAVAPVNVPQVIADFVLLVRGSSLDTVPLAERNAILQIQGQIELRRPSTISTNELKTIYQMARAGAVADPGPLVNGGVIAQRTLPNLARLLGTDATKAFALVGNIGANAVAGKFPAITGADLSTLTESGSKLLVVGGIALALGLVGLGIYKRKQSAKASTPAKTKVSKPKSKPKSRKPVDDDDDEDDED